MLPQVRRSLRLRGFRFAFVAAAFLALGLAGSLEAALMAQPGAQTVSGSTSGYPAPADRLVQPIVESNRVALPGAVHPLATKENDRGAVSDGMKLERIQVVLKRSDAQESALKQLIGEMHSPGSANFHKWLTPEDFGKQFGPSDADVAKLEGWLGSHGFSITKLNPGRQTLEIAGTAGQFRDTFHTQIHSYLVTGAAGVAETHFANGGAPEIPAALTPVFGGFASLNNFHLRSQTHLLGTAQYNPATHEATPDWTFGSGSKVSLLVAPADFAVQYDLNPLYTAGTKGDGQSIAIVNEANINIALVNNYRALFGLPVNPPQVIIDGNDPGIDGNNSAFGRQVGSSFEAYLDVEVSGAVAPNAQVNLVIAASTALQDGLALAAERAVYSNISPVLSLSFGECEAFLGSGNAFWNNLWEQAAAQGITVLVSTGDIGSAACDNDNTQQFAVYGQAVSGIASTPYNVAVGGTDFYYSGGSASLSNYWSNLSSPTTNTPSVSLLKKIPEQPFNSSQFGLNLYPQSNSSGTSIFAAGGGASTLGLPGPGAGGGYGPYPKPSWQAGTGVPADSARDLPDVSLFGSLNTNGSYTPICALDGDCATPAAVVQFSGVGGTSVSAPEFAGIMALVNQKYGRQGQANYVLYPLATQFPAAFNDVTIGTNTVPCNLNTVQDSYDGGLAIGPIDCQSASSADTYTVDDTEYGTSVEGEIGVTANTASYNAGVGYDLASGLGSVDVNNLVTNWGSVRTGTSTTTLAATPTAFAHGAPVTISGTVSGTSPTGNVAITTTSTDANTQGQTILFPVTNGAYSGTTSILPGGTYTISASYSGDGSNAPSTSAPVQVTVTPEASTTALTVYTTVLASTAGTLVSGGRISYGAVSALSVKATGTTSGTSSKPTGSVTFLDGATVLGTVVVNAEGDAELTSAFPIGLHSITAKYSGDDSFGASATVAATTFTVVANTPVFYVTYTNALSNGDAVNGQTTYVAVQVENSSNYPNAQALPPAGTVTISGAPSGVPATVALVPSVDPFGGAPEGTAYFAFPASQSGTSTLNFSFTPSDVNYTPATSGAVPITFVGTSGSIATSISASASATTTSPTSAVNVTATVSAAGGGAAPTGTVALYASEERIGIANLPTSSGSSATVTISLSSGVLFGGTNQITAQYYPSTNSAYIASATNFTVMNPLDDFALVPATTIVNVPGTGSSAGVQTDTINLNSYSGFEGAVNLACTAATGVTCSLSSSSVTLANGGTGSTVLTVNTSGVAAAGTYSVVVTGTDATGHLIHTIGLQVVTPLVVASTAPGFSLSANPTSVSISAPGGSGTSAITATPVNGFTGTVALTCTVTGPATTGAPTCSAASESITGTSAATATLTFNTVSTTTAGTYTATVTGTSGTVTATTPISVTVVGAAPGTFSLTNSATITVATQGGTGSSMISVLPGTTNPYAGAVALTCAITTTPAGASNVPSCSLSPASVTLAGTTVTSTLTINTTAQTTSEFHLPAKGLFTAGGGLALAALMFFGAPVGRRGRRTLQAVRTLRILSVALLFALIAGAGIGCGGGSSNNSGGGTTTTGGTTTGAYTVTVTGTPASGTAQTVAVAVTVN